MARKENDRFEGARLIAWHAKHISNPMDRLRYLRAATVQSPAADVTRRWRYAVPLVLATIAISSAASLRVWWVGSHPAPRQAAASAPVAPVAKQAKQPVSRPAFQDHIQNVWLVEKKGESEEYSNGLRVDNHWAVGNRPRSYALFNASRPDDGPVAWRSEPAGIVFHTTESNQVPFEPGRNGDLKTVAEGLLGYVQHKRAYNFVVDRFGRVHRVVQETDAANHSGHSVWADDKWLYLNLNDSFLGISFEAQTRHGDEPAAITPAQVREGALLIEMLRARYHVPAGNCITHAQVSVNPSNMQIGYHTDWAANFPYKDMGLPDNYETPLPGLYLCGFNYDREYLTSTGQRVETAVAASEAKLADAAVAQHMPVEAYRQFLQRQYRKKISALRKGAPEGDAL